MAQTIAYIQTQLAVAHLENTSDLYQTRAWRPAKNIDWQPQVAGTNPHEPRFCKLSKVEQSTAVIQIDSLRVLQVRIGSDVLEVQDTLPRVIIHWTNLTLNRTTLDNSKCLESLQIGCLIRRESRQIAAAVRFSEARKAKSLMPGLGV